jgi:hypothetical protein
MAMPQENNNSTRREFFQKASTTLAATLVTTLVTPMVAEGAAGAQTADSASIARPYANQDGDTMMMTIFFRHDETKTLDEIDAHLDKTGFHENFPPPGVEVVSWYVMMGIGQVVTLRLLPEKLREVNLQIEHGAWGAFRTEFYPTYDYRPVWEAQRKERR